MKKLFILISTALVAQIVYSADTMDLKVQNVRIVQKGDYVKETELSEFSIAVDLKPETGDSIASLIDKVRQEHSEYASRSPFQLLCKSDKLYLEKKDMSRRIAALEFFCNPSDCYYEEERPHIRLVWKDSSPLIKKAKQNS